MGRGEVNTRKQNISLTEAYWPYMLYIYEQWDR